MLCYIPIAFWAAISVMFLDSGIITIDALDQHPLVRCRFVAEAAQTKTHKDTDNFLVTVGDDP
jgi:hypothetical protein